MAVSPPAGLDQEIAAFLTENPDVGGESDAPADTSSDDAGDPDDSPPAEDAPEKPAAPEVKAEVDLSAVKAAIDKKDPKALLAALGPHAEELLGGKAHRALRLQVKEADKAKAAATKAKSDADGLTQQLAQKYGDPIAARKAAEDGDVDAFVTLVEKWAGRPWNDVMRWVTGGMAGRKERLEAQERHDKAAQQMKLAHQEQAQAEVRAWVDGGVKKLAPELHSPEVVEMVYAEIRKGFSAGITTPAKALPIVRKQLEAQYKMLAKVFDGGRGAAKPKPKVEAPAARATRAEGTKTRELTFEEELAEFKREQGIK